MFFKMSKQLIWKDRLGTRRPLWYDFARGVEEKVFRPMKKLVILLLVSAYAVGCGEGTPLSSEDSGLLTNVNYITLAEFDGYIADVKSTIPSFNLMIGEFSSIVADFNAGYIPTYWIGEYTKNLLLRVGEVQSRVRQIRPTHPDLLKLHIEEYEAAFEDFRIGFGLFVQGIEQPGSVSIDEVNDRIVGGNVHIIRLQILLGDLGGTFVDFFATQDSGNPDDGFDGFGF